MSDQWLKTSILCWQFFLIYNAIVLLEKYFLSGYFLSSDIYPLQKIKVFSDLVPLCKMHNSYYDTGKLGVTLGHYSSDASNYSSKIQTNFFKKFLKEFISVYNYSNSILYQLLCYWQITSTTFVAK